MSNVHGLFSNRKNSKKEDDDDDEDDENNRYVGGIGDHGGGSGLAVRPQADDAASHRDSVFRLAQNAGSESSSTPPEDEVVPPVRRTITMYRDGFVVDDGPYRRLDDPANAEFLRALAMGRTPLELVEESTGEDGGVRRNGDVVVGLVDKRQEDYVEPFRSFSGHGTSLGSGTSAVGGLSGETDPSIFDPATLPNPPPAVDETQPTTSIQVRLPNGQRRILRLNVHHTVMDLAAHALASQNPNESGPFRLVTGFPPQPLSDRTLSIQEASLSGAQVSMQGVV